MNALAQSKLTAWANTWEPAVAAYPNCNEMKRWALAAKCEALIKHDRILRGETGARP